MLMDISKNSYLKYFLFGSLYITEGIQIAIAWVLTPIYLLQQDFSPEVVTLCSGIIMIPWVIKFLFGYLVDYFSIKGRKKIIMIGGFFSGLPLILVSLIQPSESLIGFIFLLFLAQCSISFLDLSADAWAIDSSKEKERGKISGSMTIGLYMGMAIGTALLGTIANDMSFGAAFFSAGIIIIFISLVPTFFKEKIVKTKKQKLSKQLFHEFKNTSLYPFLLFLPLIALNSGIISLSVPLFMEISLHLDIAIIGFISAFFSFNRAIGSFIFGAVSDKIGRYKTLMTIMIVLIFFSAFLITVHTSEQLTIIYGIIGFLTGGLFATIFAECMDKTNPKIAATQFGIFMGILNLGELGGGAISGKLITLLDFNRVFLYAAWIVGPSILLYYFIKKYTKK